MDCVEIVFAICWQKKIAVSRLEKDLSFGNGYFKSLKRKTIPSDRIEKLASYFELPVDFLLGVGPEPYCLVTEYRLAMAEKAYAKETDEDKRAELAYQMDVLRESLEDQRIAMRFTQTEKRMVAPEVSEDNVTFPVIGEVAAGYDHIAYDGWTGDSIEIPRSYLHGREPTDFFVLRVQGDSMYPDYQDGDHVLVLRQSTMDRSGQIGVVIYDGEMGTLKRVEYVVGEDWMKLCPINPQYPPVTIRDEALEHCKVLGVAKLVVRELDQ